MTLQLIYSALVAQHNNQPFIPVFPTTDSGGGPCNTSSGSGGGGGDPTDGTLLSNLTGSGAGAGGNPTDGILLGNLTGASETIQPSEPRFWKRLHRTPDGWNIKGGHP